MNEMALSHAPMPIDLRRGAAIAQQLRDYVQQVGLTVRIGQYEYVRIEGWQFLCHLCQLPLPTIVGVRREDRDGGYAYVAEAVLDYGGREYRAFAMCSSDEPNWRGKPEYSLMSMAQTRACGKVLRLLLGWILPIAGYAATPAEEMVESTTPETQSPEQEMLRDLRRRDRERYNRILHALLNRAREVFADDEAQRAWLQQHYQVNTFNDLTIGQAQEALRLMTEAT